MSQIKIEVSGRKILIEIPDDNSKKVLLDQKNSNQEKLSRKDGFLQPTIFAPAKVKKGQLLAILYNPYSWEIINEIEAPEDGIILEFVDENKRNKSWYIGQYSSIAVFYKLADVTFLPTD